jgi:hypothetical protein
MLDTAENLKNQWLEYEKHSREALLKTDPASVFVIIQELFVDLLNLEKNSELTKWVKERDKNFVDDVKKSFPNSGIKYIQL